MCVVWRLLCVDTVVEECSHCGVGGLRASVVGDEGEIPQAAAGAALGSIQSSMAWR